MHRITSIVLADSHTPTSRTRRCSGCCGWVVEKLPDTWARGWGVVFAGARRDSTALCKAEVFADDVSKCKHARFSCLSRAADLMRSCGRFQLPERLTGRIVTDVAANCACGWVVLNTALAFGARRGYRAGYYVWPCGGGGSIA